MTEALFRFAKQCSIPGVVSAAEIQMRWDMLDELEHAWARYQIQLQGKHE
jgi:hypothetical protein